MAGSPRTRRNRRASRHSRNEGDQARGGFAAACQRSSMTGRSLRRDRLDGRLGRTSKFAQRAIARLETPPAPRYAACVKPLIWLWFADRSRPHLARAAPSRLALGRGIRPWRALSSPVQGVSSCRQVDMLAFASSKRVDGIWSDGSRPPWERMTTQLFRLTMERPRSPFTFRSGIGPIAHVLDAARLGVQVCSRKREHPSRASCRYHIFACLRGATASQSPERDTPASLDVHHHRAGVDAMVGTLYRPVGKVIACKLSAPLRRSRRRSGNSASNLSGSSVSGGRCCSGSGDPAGGRRDRGGRPPRWRGPSP